MFARNLFNQNGPLLTLWKWIDFPKGSHIAWSKIFNKDISYVKTQSCKYATDEFRPNESQFQERPTFASNVICYNCKKPGHVARDCPVPAICRLCGQSGHISTNCRSSAIRPNPERQSQLEGNQTYGSDLLCYNCRKPGHTSRDCPVPAICRLCGQSGHISTNCTSAAIRPNPERQSQLERNQTYSSDLVCYNCGKPGHTTHDCPEADICYRCGGSGHRSTNCPTPKTCYKCGSTEHLTNNCPTVVCYQCQKVGHITRDCPENNSCYRCGKTGHIARDCTSVQ